MKCIYTFLAFATATHAFAGHIDENLTNLLSLEPTSHVLEIGCAGGEDASDLSDFSPEGTVVAIDSSPFQIDTAKKTYSKKNLIFRTLDPLDLDYSNYFNAVVSFSALHWVDNHGELIERVHTALCPSGKLFFEMPNGLPNSLLSALKKSLEDDMWEQYQSNFKDDLSAFTPNEYRQILQKTGFMPLEITSLEKTITFSSKNDFIRFLIGWLPHLQSLPLGKRMRFLNHVLVHYFEHEPIQADGSIHFPVTTLTVYAVKQD